MNTSSGLRFLRPYLFGDLTVTRKSAYVCFFNTSQCLAAPTKAEKHRKKAIRETAHPPLPGIEKSVRRFGEDFGGRAPVEERVKELEKAKALVYPRVASDPATLTCADYQQRYGSLVRGEKRMDESARIYGRIANFRVAGKALIFLDIVQDGHQVQAVCNFQKLEAFAGVSSQKFRDFYHLIRRGDVVSVFGHPYSTATGEISINALELPTILSPSLATLPRKLEDRETRIRNRHVDLLVNRRVADTLRVRSHIVQHIRDFLLKDNFLEVQTPIIADKAGGAIAKPFTTVATEFSDKQLALRIAPEIWLKRLVLGGMDRVFEIGPAFRNEGLDATHNPEFTTCEFYKSFADLEDLISMTEQLLSGLAKHVATLRHYPLMALPELDAELFTIPFKRVEFIPAIESRLGEKLPDLTADGAAEKLLALFDDRDIPRPLTPTLPRLLDKLSSLYIEPECDSATFIMYHPACMAPLAKSFLDEKTKQFVSARVELFVQNRELANMYEEENSPFEQRRKFVEQAKWKDDENVAVIDESYLEALEWALPPTGGWGCGIDRLCMLFSGANRIGDVLAFGSLRNVVNLGREGVIEEAEEAKEVNVG